MAVGGVVDEDESCWFPFMSCGVTREKTTRIGAGGICDELARR
jgi:hypothetical protein